MVDCRNKLTFLQRSSSWCPKFLSSCRCFLKEMNRSETYFSNKEEIYIHIILIDSLKKCWLILNRHHEVSRDWRNKRKEQIHKCNTMKVVLLSRNSAIYSFPQVWQCVIYNLWVNQLLSSDNRHTELNLLLKYITNGIALQYGTMTAKACLLYSGIWASQETSLSKQANLSHHN